MTQTSQQYPQAERLEECTDQYHAIMTFLKWAANNGYHLAVHQPPLGQVPFMMPVFSGQWERVIHQFLEIDTDELDRERRTTIHRLREMNAH